MVDEGRKRILLVEDEALIAVAQKWALEQRGYSVEVVGSGEAAVAACEDGGVDLVLMDINLSQGIDGTEAAKLILERRDLPLVFLSSHTEIEVVEKTEKITPYGYVVKNSGIAVLDASIKMAFKLYEVNRRLAAEKRRLETVLDSIGDAVIAADLRGCVTQLNPLAERLTGFRAAEALGRPLREVLAAFGFVPPFAAALPGPSFMDAWKDSPSQGSAVALGAKGSEIRLSFTSAAIRNGDGAPSGVVLAFRDVTEEYSANEALRLREHYLTAIIENQPGLVWLKDIEGRFLAVNSAFLRSCGLGSQGEIVGKTDLDIWPRDLAEKYRSDDRAVMGSRSPKVTEEPIYDNRVPTWFETFKAPILDESGRAIGSTGYSRDITPRKRSEAELEESVGRYKALLDLAVDGMVLESADGRILEANGGFCGLVGLGKDAVVGMPPGALPFAPEAGEFPLPAEEDPRSGAAQTRERVLLRPDGGKVIVEIRSSVMPDGSRQSLYRDMTTTRLAEETLRLKSMFLEAVANSSADGILVVDLAGKKILQNRRTLELWKIPPEIANDPDGMKQVAHVMSMTKNPQQFIDEIEHQKSFPLEINRDQLELIDGTVLDRHSAPVLGAGAGVDGRNYGRIYHFHDITGFREAEKKIRGLLDEKELILREAHHRVKNYMGTLLSLLSLQASSLTEESAIQALEDAQMRIQSMVLLYDKLYVSATFGSIPASDYLPFLVDEIIGNFPSRAALSVEKRIEDFTLDAKTMRDIGIIVNELLTNIMKYAFEGRDEGRISVSAAMAEGEVTLVVGDDGVGLPESVEIDGSAGFGLRLVGMLAKQMRGSISIDRGLGTKFTLAFPASSPGPGPSARAPMPGQVGEREAGDAH